MIYDVCIRKELLQIKETSSTNPARSFTSNQRNGLEVMNFLFDFINDIAGYTEKYYDETLDSHCHDDLILKYRAEKDKYEKAGKRIDDSPLFGDHYPHCLLVIEGVHELLDMEACNT